MIPALIESILRSEFLGLRATVHFGVSGVHSMDGQVAEVLGFVLALPLLKPLTQHFYFQPSHSQPVSPTCSMTLLQELQALLQARSESGGRSEPFKAKVVDPTSQCVEERHRSTADSASNPDSGPTEPDSSSGANG